MIFGEGGLNQTTEVRFEPNLSAFCAAAKVLFPETTKFPLRKQCIADIGGEASRWNATFLKPPIFSRLAAKQIVSGHVIQFWKIWFLAETDRKKFSFFAAPAASQTLRMFPYL